MTQLSSADFLKLDDGMDGYRARVRQRFLNDFLSKEEFERRIEQAATDVAAHDTAFKSHMAEIAKEQTKLPALRDKVAKAELALAVQRNVIRLLQNKADRAKQLVAATAQEKAGYEAQLANKDHLKFKDAVG